MFLLDDDLDDECTLRNLQESRSFPSLLAAPYINSIIISAFQKAALEQSEESIINLALFILEKKCQKKSMKM